MELTKMLWWLPLDMVCLQNCTIIASILSIRNPQDGGRKCKFFLKFNKPITQIVCKIAAHCQRLYPYLTGPTIQWSNFLYCEVRVEVKKSKMAALKELTIISQHSHIQHSCKIPTATSMFWGLRNSSSYVFNVRDSKYTWYVRHPR